MALSRFFRHALATSTLLVSSLTASAAVVVYTFNSTEVATFGASPYGTVTLTEVGANVDVKVALRSDLNFVDTGGPHSIFSFNAINAAAAEVSNIKFNGVSAGSQFTVATDFENQPFGTFELLINCDAQACPNGGSGGGFNDPLSFTLLNSTAADFAFLSIGGTAAYFASDVLCTGTLAGGCTRAGATGSIGATGGGVPGSGGTPSAGHAPEPGSSALAVLGLGILGLSFAGRRKQKKAQASA